MADRMVVRNSPQALSSSRSSAGFLQRVDGSSNSSSSSTKEERRRCQGAEQMEVAVGSLFWGAALRAGVAT